MAPRTTLSLKYTIESLFCTLGQVCSLQRPIFGIKTRCPTVRERPWAAPIYLYVMAEITSATFCTASFISGHYAHIESV